MEIDFVIAWVDGSDKTWQESKAKYDTKNKNENNGVVRYRDWDELKYWFRGVEKYAPWVNKIYFVTCGQKPDWLDENNPKLVLVNHKDYMKEDYLPTFSANPIELNFHRIKGLSEHFVYFNDDMFIINPVKEDDFFKKGLPCDSYCESPLFMYGSESSFPYMLVNDSKMIAKHFNKREYLKKNFFKYINYKYGLKANLVNLFMMKYNQFSGFSYPHIPSSFLKSTYEEVWDKEEEVLDSVSRNRFRTNKDINQYLFKAWQYCTGKFMPRSLKFGDNFPITNENSKLISAIKSKKYKVLCINDGHNIEDFEKTKNEINMAFEEKFKDKCSFEK